MLDSFFFCLRYMLAFSISTHTVDPRLFFRHLVPFSVLRRLTPRGFGSVCFPFTSSSLCSSVVSGAQMSLVNVPFFDTIYGLRPSSYPRPPYLDMASMASFSSPSATNLLRVSTGIAYRFSLASDLCSISLGFCFGSSPSLSC